MFSAKGSNKTPCFFDAVSKRKRKTRASREAAMGFEPGTHVSPVSRKAAADCRAVRERVPLYFPCAERPGRLGWACWLSGGLGAEAKGSWGRPCLSGLLAQARAGQLGLGSRSEGLGGLGWAHEAAKRRLLAAEQPDYAVLELDDLGSDASRRSS